MSKPIALPTADDVDAVMRHPKPIRPKKTPPMPPPNVPDGARNGASGGERGESGGTSGVDPPDSGWGVPTPLEDGATPPPFPLDALYPESARRFVAAVAEANQVDPALPAMIYLGLASGCVCYSGGGRRLIRPEPEWAEQPNLFVAVALPSGERKSKVFRQLCEPIEEHERTAQREAHTAVAQAESELRRLKARLTKAENKAADDDTHRGEAQRLAEQVESFVVPRLPRLLTDDVTPERLASLLAEQGGRIMAASAECDLFGILRGRYSDRGAVNLGPFLKGHAGDLLVVDRQGKPSFRVERPMLTIVVCCQPEALGEMLADDALRHRGMNNRWLFAKPRSMLGERRIHTVAIPSSIAEGYRNLVLGQLAWERTTIQGPINTASVHDPRIVTLSPIAKAVLDAWRERHERELRAEGRMGAFGGWGSKLPGAAVRIAGVMTLMANPAATEIGEEIVRASLTIADWATEHALLIFGDAGLDPDVVKAKRLLGHLQRRRVDSFTRSQAWQWVKGPGHRTFGRASDLNGALDVLEAHGWIGRNDGDGKRWNVHPSIWTK